MAFTLGIYELLVAPKLSELTVCNMPDMSDCYEQSKYWISNYLLNSILIQRLNTKAHIYILNQLRRSQSAFNEYCNAKSAMENYILSINEKNPTISLYLKSLFHLEMFISQSYQSFLFLKTFLKDNNCPKDIEIFENQKALYETKLRKFYNFSKHMDEKILEGHHLETGGVALWITSAGLEYKSEETGDIWCFQWEEMKTVLLDLVESAEFILKVHSVPLDSTCQKLAFTPQN